MKKRKVLLQTEKCKSCGLCVNACNQNALSLTHELNEKGYYVVGITEDKCIGCGMCYLVCPDGVFSIVEECD